MCNANWPRQADWTTLQMKQDVISIGRGFMCMRAAPVNVCSGEHGLGVWSGPQCRGPTDTMTLRPKTHSFSIAANLQTNDASDKSDTFIQKWLAYYTNQGPRNDVG